MAVTAGQLYRLARQLRDLALTVTGDPGERPPSLGLVTITDDVAHHEDTTVGEVAARTGLAQSLVSKTVAQLRDAGVVETRPDERDRRRTRLRITDAARSHVFATRGERSMTAALRQRFPDLPGNRITELEALLERLAATFDGRTAPTTVASEPSAGASGGGRRVSSRGRSQSATRTRPRRP